MTPKQEQAYRELQWLGHGDYAERRREQLESRNSGAMLRPTETSRTVARNNGGSIADNGGTLRTVAQAPAPKPPSVQDKLFGLAQKMGLI